MTFSKKFPFKLRVDPRKDKSYSQSILALKKALKVKHC